MPQIDFPALASRLLSRSTSLLAEWFPNGRLDGHEFKVGSLGGEPGASLSINVHTGRWADFAAAEQGGDLISLYAAMHAITQAEAAHNLEGENTILQRVPVTPAKPADPERPVWTPVMPIPAEAPRPPDSYMRRGPSKDWFQLKFVKRWTYTNAAGEAMAHTVRFEWYEGDKLCKDIVPQTYCQNEAGDRQWCWRSMPSPRPLYNLAELTARPDAPVMVVEGEKKVHALQSLAANHNYVGVAWAGGCNAWKKTDWTPLAGRNVILWPDCDRQRVESDRAAKQYRTPIGELIPEDLQPGLRAMWMIAHALFKACPTVKVIVPRDIEVDGWDIADAIAEGWDWARIVAWARRNIHDLAEGHHESQGSSEGGQRKNGRADDEVRHGKRTRVEQDDDQGSHQTLARDSDVRIDDRGAARAASESSEQPARTTADSGRPAPRSGRNKQSAGDTLNSGARRDGEVGGSSEARSRVPRGKGIHPAANGEDRARFGEITASDGTSGANRLSTTAKWLAWGIETSGSGAPRNNLNNAVRVLELDPVMRDRVWIDEFLGRMMTGEPPREWTAADDLEFNLYLQRNLNIQTMGLGVTKDAVIHYASKRTRNCVKEYMESIEHDGTPRIDDFFPTIYGCQSNDYTRAVGRNFWIAIAARVFDPGCKFDNMVVLEGGEGVYKSMSLEIIGGAWFTTQHESATNTKAFAEILEGKLVIEVDEMDSFNRTEVTGVKKIISNRSDRYRNSYAPRATDHPRQCVMVGTTNRNDWNKSDTGARRFWPIACRGEVQVDLLRALRNQYFAEALARYRSGESWWNVPKRAAKAEQDARHDDDAWMQVVTHYVIGRDRCRPIEIACGPLDMDIADVNQVVQNRIASCLRHLGWFRTTEWENGKAVKCWRPPGDQYGELPADGKEISNNLPHGINHAKNGDFGENGENLTVSPDDAYGKDTVRPHGKDEINQLLNEIDLTLPSLPSDSE